MEDTALKIGLTRDFLQKHRISPHNVIFEITERNAIDDFNGFQSTISHYQSQNYQIAIDDIGTGYSGLNLIRNVDPNYMKLDMALIRNIHDNNLKSAIVKGMVEFSKVSNVKLIAEGVETYEELESLIHLGVQYGQGFYFQAPKSEVYEIQDEVLAAIYEINTRSHLLNRASIHNPFIRNLCTATEVIPPHTPVTEVYDYFKRNLDSFGLTIVENNIPLGTITREKLNLMLSGQYGFTLHQKKLISDVMDKNFLSVESQTLVNVVSSLAMARANDKLYDFIVVTEEEEYLGTVTVKTLLKKSIEIEVSSAKHQNPLSGLPGNVMIEQTLNEFLRYEENFSVIYIDIDHFKAYNDVHGFESGDLIIKLLADILRDYVPFDQFIGHIGGDDFIVITNDHQADRYIENIVRRFESEIVSYYYPADVEKGYITARNRKGAIENFPLTSLTAVCLTNEADHYQTTYEISSKLAEMKRQAKQQKFQNYSNNQPI